jgi:putative peptidoglycan lipid II flippase
LAPASFALPSAIIHRMSIAKNSAKITALGTMGMLTGIVVDVIMTALFGLSAKTDAYFAASTVPITLMTIIWLQAGKVTQPLFIHRRASGGADAGWKFLNDAILRGTLLTTALCAVGILFAGTITGWQMSGQSSVAGSLAKQLGMVFFLAPIMMCPCIIMCTGLTALQDFTLPGMARVIENLAKVLVAVTLFSRLGIFVLPIGLLIGIAVQNVLVYRALARHGYKFRLELQDPLLKPAGHISQTAYPFVGYLLSMGIEVLQNMLATSLGPGALSALRLATRIIDAFSGLVANSVLVAVTPVVTQNLSAGEDKEMKQSMLQGAKLMLLFAAPAIAWFVFMGAPSIEVLFQRKNFLAEDTALVAAIMALMSPYILLSRMYGLVEVPFYGSRDTWTPLVANIALASVYCVLMLVTSRLLGVYGFPISRSISYLGGCLVLVLLLRRRFGDMGWKGIFSHAWRVLLAVTIFSLTIVFCHRALANVGFTSFIWKIFILAASGGIGLAFFCWSAVLVGALDGTLLQRRVDRLLRRIGMPMPKKAG